MKYRRKPINLPLVLGADGAVILKWWIYALFEVQLNMRVHTGGGLSMGRGFPVVTSTKHNIDTQRSTEAEIVVVDDCVSAFCWTG